MPLIGCAGSFFVELVSRLFCKLFYLLISLRRYEVPSHQYRGIPNLPIGWSPQRLSTFTNERFTSVPPSHVCPRDGGNWQHWLQSALFLSSEWKTILNWRNIISEEFQNNSQQKKLLFLITCLISLINYTK